ncbi:MAG: hypothetical protein GY894_10450 [Planctomycetes bacterium]|jgi:hypothetical protein|nr:hypothetical protein [Planctomycetota bacterium]
MMDWVNKWKRPAMGWVGLGSIAAGIAWVPADITLRLAILTIGLALICMAMPTRIWANFRSWWTD